MPPSRVGGGPTSYFADKFEFETNRAAGKIEVDLNGSE